MKFIDNIKKEIEEERKENELEWLIKNSLEIGYKGNGYITDKAKVYQVLHITGKIDLIKIRKILFWKREFKIEIRK